MNTWRIVVLVSILLVFLPTASDLISIVVELTKEQLNKLFVGMSLLSLR